MPEQVIKSGEEWLRLSLIPHKRGMLVEVKVHPLVEEFIRAMGERTAGVEEWVGRHTGWEAVDESERITVYRSEAVVRDDNRHFTLGNIGTNIVDDGDRINLSFLRIVGISNGVRFISTKEVYPLEYRRQLKQRIGNAFREFVREYIKPVRMTLVMTSQEI